MLADLLDGWAPIAIGTITPNTFLHSKFDYTYQYMQVSKCRLIKKFPNTTSKNSINQILQG